MFFDFGVPDRRRRFSQLWTGFTLSAGGVCGLALLLFSYGSALTDPDGISALARKPASWDFTNLWFGGKLVLSGEKAILFDPDLYRARLREMFAPGIDDSEWSYPPQALLFGVPLALVGLYTALAIWTLATLALLMATCRLLGVPLKACLLLLIAPAALTNILFGQNGALTASLLLGGLYLSHRHPAKAGLAIGLLAFKPHLGLLVPVALSVSHRWRAFLWAVVFCGTGAALTHLFFGPLVWTGFLGTTRPLMQGILEAPFGQDYHANAITVFALARASGAALPLAYAVQIAVTLACIALTIWLWRRTDIDPVLRCITMAPLALLATPYSFSYDMTTTSVAMLVLFVRNGYRFTLLTGLVWLWPVINHIPAGHHLPMAPLVLLAALAACLQEIERNAPGRRVAT